MKTPPANAARDQIRCNEPLLRGILIASSSQCIAAVLGSLAEPTIVDCKAFLKPLWAALQKKPVVLYSLLLIILSPGRPGLQKKPVVLHGLVFIMELRTRKVVLHSLLIIPHMSTTQWLESACPLQPLRIFFTTATENFPKSSTKSSFTYRHNAY